MPTVQRMYGDIVIAHILGIAQWKYFIFFVLGMFVKHNAKTIYSDRGGAAIVMAFLIVYVANAIGDFQLNGFLYNINLLLKEISIVLKTENQKQPPKFYIDIFLAIIIL